MLSSSGLMPVLSKITNKNVNDMSYRSLLNGVLSYSSNAVQQRWCLTPTLLQDEDCLSKSATASSVLGHNFNTELLLLSEAARKDILNKFPKVTKIDSFDFKKPMKMIVPIDKLAKTHPLSILISPTLLKCVESIKIEMYEENNTLRKPVGDEKYVWITAELLKKDSFKTMECQKGDKVRALYVYNPRNLNQFSLITTKGLKLNETFKGADKGKGINFFGKVYVGGSGKDKGNIDVFSKKKLNVGFHSQVSIEGNITSKSSKYSPDSFDGLTNSQYESFNGFYSGYNLEQVADKGIDNIFMDSKLDLDLMAYCAQRSRLKNELELTSFSRLFVKKVNTSNDSGSLILGLSEKNEFVELFSYNIFPPGDNPLTSLIDIDPAFDSSKLNGPMGEYFGKSIAGGLKVSRILPGNVLNPQYPENGERFERSPVMDLIIQPVYKSGSKHIIDKNDYILASLSRSSELTVQLFEKDEKLVQQIAVLQNIGKRYELGKYPLDSLSKRGKNVEDKLKDYSESITKLKNECEALPKISNTIKKGKKQIRSNKCGNFSTIKFVQAKYHYDSVGTNCISDFPSPPEPSKLKKLRVKVEDLNTLKNTSYNEFLKQQALLDKELEAKKLKEQDVVNSENDIQLAKDQILLDQDSLESAEKKNKKAIKKNVSEEKLVAAQKAVDDAILLLADSEKKLVDYNDTKATLDLEYAELVKTLDDQNAILLALKKTYEDNLDLYQVETEKLIKAEDAFKVVIADSLNIQNMCVEAKSKIEKELSPDKGWYYKMNDSLILLIAELIKVQEDLDKNTPYLTLKTGGFGSFPLSQRADQLALSYKMEKINKLKSYDKFKELKGVRVILRPFDFGYNSFKNNIRMGLSVSEAAQPGPTEMHDSNFYHWGSLDSTEGRKLNRMYLDIDADNSKVTLNRFVVGKDGKGKMTSSWSGTAWKKLRLKEENNNSYRYVTSSDPKNINYKYPLEKSFEYNEVCDDNVALSASDWDIDLSDTSQFSWTYQVEAPGIVIENPTITPLEEYKISDNSRAFESTSPSVSIVNKCIIGKDATFVFGFYVCRELKIEARNKKLNIIGTFIVEKIDIDESAYAEGVNFYSIWEKDAIALLVDSGKLKKSSTAAKGCEFSGEKSLWRSNLHIKDKDDLYGCSPVKFTKEGPDNFNWTTVDPEVGLISGQPATTQKIKNRYKRYMTHELFKRFN
jgi:hypothetical protein